MASLTQGRQVTPGSRCLFLSTAAAAAAAAATHAPPHVRLTRDPGEWDSLRVRERASDQLDSRNWGTASYDQQNLNRKDLTYKSVQQQENGGQIAVSSLLSSLPPCLHAFKTRSQRLVSSHFLRLTLTSDRDNRVIARKRKRRSAPDSDLMTAN